MWSSPVMFGGGKHIVNLGLPLLASATNRPSDSQRAYQPASMAFGSNAFGISDCNWACFITWLRPEAPARRSLLARLSRRGYGYASFAAHDAQILAPAALSIDAVRRIGPSCAAR